MGLIFRAWPELATGRLAVVQFVLSTGSAFILLLCISNQTWPLWPASSGSSAALLFLARLLRLVFRHDLTRQPARQPPAK